MIEVGTIVGGKYRVERVIGRGGMGVVATATHLELGQEIALKVMLGADSVGRDRFLREARTPMRLKSDHVCRVFDVGALDSGTPYIVMELLTGSDLASVVAHRALPIALAVDYVLQAMIALAEAHAQGIVHRDLKPANLFLTQRIDGSPLVKVLDFGIAMAPSAEDTRLTQTSALMGSPAYMSPEQLMSARDVDARTDVWALGAILYQLVSGRIPFAGATITELAVKIATESPAPLDVDPRFRAIVWRCLEKDLGARYQDVAALAHDLATFGGPGARATAELVARLRFGHQITPSVAVSMPPTHRSVSKLPWVAVGAIVAIGVGVAASRHDTAPTAARPDASYDFSGLSPAPPPRGNYDLESELASLHCVRAASLLGPKPDPDMVGRVEECASRRAFALGELAKPTVTLTHESEAYVTGFLEELPPEKLEASRTSLFLPRVLAACDRKDAERAQRDLANIGAKKRANAIDYCAREGVSLK